MDTQNIRIGCRFGVEKIFARGDGVLCQFVGDETVFLRGDHVGAEVQIIALVINELEGQHDSSHGNRRERRKAVPARGNRHPHQQKRLVSYTTIKAGTKAAPFQKKAQASEGGRYTSKEVTASPLEGRATGYGGRG